MGFARSRREARNLVNHSHFLVNGKSVNIPSFQVSKGTKIDVKPSKQNNNFFQLISLTLKNYKAPDWLRADIKKMSCEVVGEPTLEDVNASVDISSIFEFYSR